jgi:hypothetical protein
LLLIGLCAAACAQPLHRRTYVFAIPGHGGYRHPAVVPAEVVERALAVVERGDRAGMARAVVRALARIGPEEAVYYRHPHGGAWLFGVRGNELTVEGYGMRHGVHKYALPAPADAPDVPRHARLEGPVKVVDVGGTMEIAKSYPELVVECSIAVDQYLFVDDAYLGMVRAGQADTFQVPAGRHVISASDDRSGDLNPMAQQFEFESGRRYDMLVMPWIKP